MGVLHFFTALAAVASLISAATASETLFSNGQIYTMNPALPWAEAMIIKDGVIKFVGTNANAQDQLSSDINTVDLEDNFVMPGIIDTHTHPGLVAALTEEEGPNGNIMNPASERLNISQMLQGYTINGARQLGTEDCIGSLEIGKAADFTILDANPLTVDNYEIHQITPTDVYLNGVSQHLSRSE